MKLMLWMDLENMKKKKLKNLLHCDGGKLEFNFRFEQLRKFWTYFEFQTLLNLKCEGIKY